MKGILSVAEWSLLEAGAPVEQQNVCEYNVSTIRRVLWSSVISCQAVQHASERPQRLHLVDETRSSKKKNDPKLLQEFTVCSSALLLFTPTFSISPLWQQQHSRAWQEEGNPSEPLGDAYRQDGVFTGSWLLSALQLPSIFFPPIPSFALTRHVLFSALCCLFPSGSSFTHLILFCHSLLFASSSSPLLIPYKNWVHFRWISALTKYKWKEDSNATFLQQTSVSWTKKRVKNCLQTHFHSVTNF